MKTKMFLLFFCCLIHGSAESKDPQSLLKNMREGLTSMHATFVQYQLTEDEAKQDLNVGEVWLQSPNQFRWFYQHPMEQLIIADGEEVWVYDEDLEQVTVKTQNNQLNPIYVIINKDLSEQHYTFKYESSEQNIDWISLTPKDETAEVKTVWLAIKNNIIEQIKVINPMEQTLIFEFQNVSKNPKLDQSLFLFTPPEGVDVIREPSPQLGESF